MNAKNDKDLLLNCREKRFRVWLVWISISKRVIEANFRWSKLLRSKLKCGQIAQSKIAQKRTIALKSNLLSSKSKKKLKIGQIYCKFAHKMRTIMTSNVALYRRLKEGSLFGLRTAINRLMLQLQLQPILKFRRL